MYIKTIYLFFRTQLINLAFVKGPPVPGSVLSIMIGHSCRPFIQLDSFYQGETVYEQAYVPRG